MLTPELLTSSEVELMETLNKKQLRQALLRLLTSSEVELMETCFNEFLLNLTKQLLTSSEVELMETWGLGGGGVN